MFNQCSASVCLCALCGLSWSLVLSYCCRGSSACALISSVELAEWQLVILELLYTQLLFFSQRAVQRGVCLAADMFYVTAHFVAPL